MWIWVGVVACGKTSSPTPESTGSGTTTTAAVAAGPPADTADAFDTAIAQLGKRKAAMCACRDTTCATQAMEDYKMWRMEMKRTTVGKTPTPAQDVRGKALDRELVACRKAIEAGLTGLGSGSAPPGADPLDAALVEYESFKAKMCACANKACADKVQDDVKTWERMLRTKVTQPPNSVQKLRGQAIEAVMKTCRQAAEAATPGAAGAGPKIEAMLAKLAAFKDQLCACADKPCLERVDKDMTTWMTAAAKDLADAKPTADQDARADKLQAEMKGCIAKVK